MLTKPTSAWALVDSDTGTLLVLDGSVPIFWFRKVAEREAIERGLTTSGRTRDVRICRVDIQQHRERHA